MEYINRVYYDSLFGDSDMSATDFSILVDVSSTLISCICCPPPKGAVLLKTEFKKAVAYQVKFLYEQGGIEAVFGQSDAAYSGGSESLGDYSVSHGSGSTANQTMTIDNIPVCGYTTTLLKQLGLMTRLVRRA